MFILESQQQRTKISFAFLFFLFFLDLCERKRYRFYNTLYRDIFNKNANKLFTFLQIKYGKTKSGYCTEDKGQTTAECQETKSGENEFETSEIQIGLDDEKKKTFNLVK